MTRQWLFYFAAILSGVLTILCTFMRESRPSQLLRLRVQDISHDINFHKLTVDSVDAKPTARSFIRDSLTMPLRLFFTEPIVFLTSIMGATVYGVIYLFTAAIPEIYTKSFGFTAMQASLVFVAIIVGVFFTLLPRIYDIRLASRKSSSSNNNNDSSISHAIEPEDKLFGFYIAAPILAIGL